MTRTDEAKIAVALTEAIDQALQQLGEQGVALPFLGRDIAEIAAQAVLAVLRAADDTQACLRADGMLNEDDD